MRSVPYSSSATPLLAGLRQSSACQAIAPAMGWFANAGGSTYQIPHVCELPPKHWGPHICGFCACIFKARNGGPVSDG